MMHETLLPHVSLAKKTSPLSAESPTAYMYLYDSYERLPAFSCCIFAHLNVSRDINSAYYKVMVKHINNFDIKHVCKLFIPGNTG